MSSNWKPDDSILETGSDRIREATGVSDENEIVTSRDERRQPLPGRRMPPGIEQTLLAVALPGNMLAFQTSFEPDVVLPSHSHADAATFRVVLEGSLYYGDVELKAGDWMYVPAGKSYEIRTGVEPCRLWHIYIGGVPIFIPIPGT